MLTEVNECSNVVCRLSAKPPSNPAMTITLTKSLMMGHEYHQQLYGHYYMIWKHMKPLATLQRQIICLCKVANGFIGNQPWVLSLCLHCSPQVSRALMNIILFASPLNVYSVFRAHNCFS